MKKKLIISGLILTLLTGCSLKEPYDAYGQDYYTPEFFLARADSSKSSVRISSGGYSVKDYSSEIRDEIFKSDDFLETTRTSSNVNEYFSYTYTTNYSKIGNSFTSMRIYKDGFLTIEYKEPTYKAKTWNYEISSTRANGLYSFVENKINYAKEVENKAKEKALEDGKIENFIAYAKRFKGVFVQVYHNSTTKSFNDDGPLFNAIEETEYTFLNHDSGFDFRLVYNLNPSDILPWTFRLEMKKKEANLRYWYKDELGREFMTFFTYKLSKESYDKIYNLGVSLLQQSTDINNN